MTERPDSPREAGLRERLSDILAEDARWVASEADTRHVRDVWDELGIHCSPRALRFVEEFNGTGFDYPRHPLDPGTHSCELNAERASRIVNGEKLRGYEQRTGEKLTPMGTAAFGPRPCRPGAENLVHRDLNRPTLVLLVHGSHEER
ncbi:hypothetical protein PO587_04090 [Streptomyces gilvifuscus]|uniref:Uncharacterized protein n=1 Tax=Streptomyces gilvifuscus TaxID=1550617 RepID=A0ABT5FM75_9ACTN|nr:hypothetical protein [Streptomyces gilvifuscus]MDC2953632.1 hypothetical protein [Streptomyces gilvifuscus]